MKTHRRFLCAAAMALLGATGGQLAQAQFTNSQFTPIEEPLGAQGTVPNGIFGNTIVGVYADSSGLEHGFTFDGTTYTTLDHPNGTKTELYGVSGNFISGSYQPSSTTLVGFIYDGSTFTTINYPGSFGKVVAYENGIAIGAYTFTGPVHGFIYDGTTYTTLDVPNGTQTVPSGISGGRVVGSFIGADGFNHGFLYSSGSFFQIDDPLASPAHGGTQAFSLSGDNITGIYFDASAKAHGFIYSNSTYITFDHPLGVGGTQLGAIDGVNLVGFYTDAQGKDHGFLATPMPQPLTAWQTGHGISAAVASDTVMYGDGVPLLEKYFIDIDPSRPMNSDDRAVLPTIVSISGGGTPVMSLRYRKSATATQVKAQVQTSPDMVHWTDDTTDTPYAAANEIATGDPILVVLVHLTGGARFVRLQVTGP